MTHKNLKIVVAIFLLGGALTAQAQIRPSYSFPPTPTGGSQMGESPFFFSPYAGIAVGRDDNLFLSPNNEKASTVVIPAVGFRIDARRPGMVFQATYDGQLGRYIDSKEDNYSDHAVRGSLDTAFSERNFLRVGLDVIRGHDSRGSTDRPLSNSPDVYRLVNAGATYAYGAPGAQGRVEVFGSTSHRDYTNNREFTAISDRITNDFGGAFYWRVAPKTYALVESRKTIINYEIFNPSGGEEIRYYAGVSWEATAATTGTLKFGQLQRKFDGDIPKAKFTSWEGIIDWAPRTYSKFEFVTSRQTQESTGLGDFILTSAYGLNWNHAWNSVLSTNVAARYQKDEYQGFDRTDTTKSLGFKVGYRFRRWLTLGAEYNFITRDSNSSIYEYDRNLYLLTATASM